MRLTVALLSLAVAAVSPEIQYFQYKRALSSPQQNGQSCVVLDPQVFAYAAPNLSDLRLYSDGRPQREMPYVIHMDAPVRGGDQRASLLNVGVQAGQTVFDAVMPPGSYRDLSLDVAGANFIATVTVSGSQAQDGSQTKIGAYTVFDLAAQKLGRSTIIHLPESDFRYLHFRIDSAVKPESVNGLTVEGVPQAQPQFVTVTASNSLKQDGKSSLVEFTVPANLPVDRVRFDVGATPAMFSRAVSVQVRSVPERQPAEGVEPATLLSAGDILRVHREEDGYRIDEERLVLPVAANILDTASKWTVRIENGDDAPLLLTSVSLQMLQREVCFDGSAKAGFALYYGDPALTAPHYDYAELFTPKGKGALLSLGPEQANPQYRARPDARPFTEKHPALLLSALVGVIALLGLVAVRSLKREETAI